MTPPIDNVINRWLANDRPLRTASMHFEGPVLYSYQTPIAKRWTNYFVTLESRHKSRTTARHVNWTAHYISCWGVIPVRVPDPLCEDHDENIRWLCGQMETAIRHGVSAWKYTSWWRQQYEARAQQLTDYCKAFELEKPRKPVPDELMAKMIAKMMVD